MNILITRFPFESAMGGEEHHTICLAEFLRRENNSVTFAGSCPVLLHEFKKRNFLSTYIWGSKMVVTPWQLLKFFFLWPIILANFYRRFSKIFRSRGINLVYCMSLNDKLILTPIALSRNIKVVWVEHQLIKNWLLKSPLRYVYRYWSKKVTIIPISPVNKRTLLEDIGVCRENIEDITNGINIDEFLISEDVTRRANVIGTVARLIPKKGVSILIESFATLSKEYPQAKLEIIGEGEEKENGVRLISSLNLTNKVKILPLVSREEYIATLKSWDLFVLPSIDESETFGLAAAEAMAAGCKVVVTEVCGIADHLGDDSGVVIAQANNVNSLKKCMKYALNTPESIRDDLTQEAQEKFDILRMFNEYQDLFGAGKKMCCNANRHKEEHRKHLVFLDQGEYMGGAEMFLSELISHLNPNKFKITLLSGNPENHKFYYNEAVVNIVRADFPRLSIRNIYKYCLAVRNLKKLLHHQDADVLISNTVRTNFLAAKLSRSTKLPLIWIFQDFTFPPFLLKLLIKFPIHIFTCSKSVKQWVLEKTSAKYRQKISVLYPYGTDHRHQNIELKKTNTIGMVGRIIPWKGQEEFIRAFHLLHTKHPELKAVIVGRPYDNNPKSQLYYRSLLTLINQLHMESSLTVKPHVESVYKEIATWKVLVHASLTPEPLGRVILEAMEAGTPAVASSKGGGPAELIKTGSNGYLVDPEDSNELATVIEGLIANQLLSESITQKGREYVNAHMNWKKKREEFEKVIRDILS